DRHLRAALTLSTLVGLAVAGAIAASAPLAALAMRDARVTPILRALGSAFAIQGVAVAAGALLRRRLRFRRLFFIDTASYLAGYGVVATMLAIAGYGVWSLVWGSLVQTAITTAAQIAAARPPMRPVFAGRETRELLHFGVGAGTSSWINYLALN